jgi:hypothetical protein
MILPAPALEIAAGRFSESYGYLKPLASAAEAPESNQQNYRVDENINSTNSLFFRYSWSSYNGTSGGLNATGNSGQTIYNAQVRAYQGAWTKTISHSILNEFRFGYIHTINDNDAPLIDQADFNALGIQGGYSDISQYELPNVLFSGNGLSGGGTGINSPTLDRTGIWDGSDSRTICWACHKTLLFPSRPMHHLLHSHHSPLQMPLNECPCSSTT